MSSSRCTPAPLLALAAAGGTVSYVPAAATAGAAAGGRSPMYTPFDGGGVTLGVPRIVGNVVTCGCPGVGTAVMPCVGVAGAGVTGAGIAGVAFTLLAVARLL